MTAPPAVTRGGGSLPLRRRLYRMLEAGDTHHLPARVFDWFMALLVITNVVAVALETVPSYQAAYGTGFEAFNVVSIVIFTIEYGLRLWVALEHPPVALAGPVWGRLQFAMRPAMLIDLAVVASGLLALVMPGLDLRLLRLIRIVRFLKLARFSPALTTFWGVIVRERRALAGGAMLLFGMAVLCAAVMYIVEGPVQPDKFGSIPAAMYWAIATLTTVGYGDVTPVTPLGKLISMIVMLIGIGVFALPIGILSTGYIEEIRRREFAVTWGMVARVPLFARLDAVAVSEIMRALHAKLVRRGEVISYAGEHADCMFFIASGEVELVLADRTAVLGNGDFFGEMSLLRAVPRAGTARALVRTDLLVLHAADFQSLMKRRPDIHARITEALAAFEVAQGPAEGDVLPDEAGPPATRRAGG